MPKYVVAGVTFERKEDFIVELRRILHAGEPGSDVLGADEILVGAMLLLRPDKLQEIDGRQIAGYFRDRQPGPLSSTNCFYVRLADGTCIDFSFMKAVQRLQPGVDPLALPV